MSEMSATRKAAIWVVVVFLLGAALGGVGGYYYAHHLVLAQNAPLPDDVKRAHRVQQLTQLLNLTSAQSQQLDIILMQKHAEAKAIHEQTDAQIEQIRQRGRDQIRAILTPEQKPKFEEFLKTLDAQRKHDGQK